MPGPKNVGYFHSHAFIHVDHILHSNSYSYPEKVFLFGNSPSHKMGPLRLYIIPQSQRMHYTSHIHSSYITATSLTLDIHLFTLYVYLILESVNSSWALNLIQNLHKIPNFQLLLLPFTLSQKTPLRSTLLFPQKQAKVVSLDFFLGNKISGDFFFSSSNRHTTPLNYIIGAKDSGFCLFIHLGQRVFLFLLYSIKESNFPIFCLI